VSGHRLALRSFPREWHRRYGQELLATLEATDAEKSSIKTSLDVVRAGMTERLRRLRSRRRIVLGAAPLALLAVIGALVGFQLSSSTTRPTIGASTRGVTTICTVALSLPDVEPPAPPGDWAVTITWSRQRGLITANGLRPPKLPDVGGPSPNGSSPVFLWRETGTASVPQGLGPGTVSCS
jgi:hypothetical protein